MVLKEWNSDGKVSLLLLSCSQISSIESIALANVARVESFTKPADSLRGSAMRKRVGDDLPLRFALEPIIADGACGSQRFLDVARFEDTLLRGVMRPDSRQEIGL